MSFFIGLIFVSCLGLVLGSFTTALVYRIPLGLDWVSRRSECTSCHAKLGVMDLIPLFSWLLSRGACRHCRAKVSLLYPAIEIAVLILCVCIYIFVGMGAQAAFLMAAVPLLVALAVIDLERMILPNVLVLLLGILGLIRLIYFSAFSDVGFEMSSFLPFVLGGFGFAGLSFGLGFLLTRVLKRNSLGFGDVKFFGVAGLWLGLSVLPWFCVLSGVCGVFMALVWRVLGLGHVFPFGPALILSMFLLLLWQEQILL